MAFLSLEGVSKYFPTLSLQVKVERTTSTINVWYTPGAIGNVIKRTGNNGQGLEPDEGKPSRPVLRGLESGNTLRLPGGSPQPLFRRSASCSLVYSNTFAKMGVRQDG